MFWYPGQWFEINGRYGKKGLGRDTSVVCECPWLFYITYAELAEGVPHPGDEKENLCIGQPLVEDKKQGPKKGLFLSVQQECSKIKTTANLLSLTY